MYPIFYINVHGYLKIGRNTENRQEKKAGVAERNDRSLVANVSDYSQCFPIQEEYPATPGPFQ